MGDDNSLLIKINADASNASKAFDDIRDKTGSLESSLSTVALVSGVAFAALTAEIYLSVEAYAEAQKSSVELSNALQNQGIFTTELKEQYKSYAEAISAATGVESASIEKAQALAQTYLGQIPVTKELTQAIVDYGAKTGDLNTAAELIGRTIGTGTNAFHRQGLVIDATSTEAERMAKVLDFVNTKAGGLAEAFNVANGYTTALATAFKEFQVEIGSHFAPFVSAARQAMIALLDVFKQHPILIDVAAAAIAVGAALSGIGVAIALAIPAFLALSAAAAAFGTTVAIAAPWLVAIGLLVTGVVLLAANWGTAMAAIKAAGQGMVTLISELFAGLGAVLSGAFHLDPSKIKEGLNQITGAFKKAKDDTVETFHEITAANKIELEVQDQDKAKFAAKEAAERENAEGLLIAIRKAEIEAIKLTNEHASADIIKLKGEEINTLKALQKTQSTEEIAGLREKLAQIRALEVEQINEDAQRTKAFTQAQLDTKEELARKDIQISAQLSAQQLAILRATEKSEQDIDRDVQTAILQKKIAARNLDLLDRKKYGVAVAQLDAALHSEEITGATSAASNLVALQNSKNSTLKAIGKVAAIEQVTVQTATAAMNIFEGFSTIPFIGYALGIAGAAAAIAYGAEQIGSITAAAQGGLITGGTPGLDSVPALLTPGELVVPTKNFDQVVGAVQNQNSGGGSSDQQAQMVQILQNIDSKFSNPHQTIIQGDVQADNSYIDALVKKISDAIEFRNGKVFGLNIGVKV